MLGEEPHKATLDSSAGDNRIVCAVIYTVWHWEVSSTLKGLGSLANSRLPSLHGNKIPIVPPRLLGGPHYLFSIQLKIIKSSSKHTPEGIGYFINKWRTKKMVCNIMVWNHKTRLCSFLAFLSRYPPPKSLWSSQAFCALRSNEAEGIAHCRASWLKPWLEGNTLLPLEKMV